MCTRCRGKCHPAVVPSGFVKFLIGAAGLDGSSGFSGSTAVKTVSLRLNLHVYCSLLACVWRAVTPWGGTTPSKEGRDKQKGDWQDGDRGAAQVGLGNSSSPVVQKLCHAKQVA